MRPKLQPTPVYPEFALVLDLRSTVPPLFHWFLFVPNVNGTEGRKIHAISLMGPWQYDNMSFNLDSSHAVATAAVIGELKGFTVDNLNELLREIPMDKVPDVDINKEPKFTCRVWIREAIRRMNAAGFVDCKDVDALENEIQEFGARAAEEIESDTFSVATLYRSRTCCSN